MNYTEKLCQNLDTFKKSNSLDKLLNNHESENGGPVEKQSYVDERMWETRTR